MSTKLHNIKKTSIIAFSLIAIVIVIFSQLIAYNLIHQSKMLHASSISYEQRILLERANKQIHLLFDENKNMSNRIIKKIKSDIIKNAKNIKQNQSKLREILLGNNQNHLEFCTLLYSKDLSGSLEEIDQHWSQFEDRLNKIASVSLTNLRTGYQYWQPVDTLIAHNGLLFNKISELNEQVVQASLDLNKNIRILYLFILGLVLTGLWLIWYLTLRPLSKRLEENYQEIIIKNSHLEYQANHDSMTLLCNRAAFNKKLDSLIQSDEGISNSSLILIDVDDFKNINDNLGHQMGDEVLIAISEVMQKSPLANETAYRLGGDEFAIIMDHVKDHDELIERLENLIKDIRLPISTSDNQKVSTSCSIGVAWGNKCGNTSDEVFSAADYALYRVKDNGRDDYLLFDDISDQNVTEMLKIEKELFKAVEEKQFIVEYQPIVNMNTDKIDSFEALARWNHPEKGKLLPKNWIGTANRLGLTSKISFQIMDLVENDHRLWCEKSLPTVPVYINITEQMILNGSAYLQLKEILKRTNDKQQWLGIEVTESIVFEKNFDKIQEQLQLIHEAGVKISLDNFGTGFANLSHIRRIKFDSLKIDESFTSKILEDPDMYLIVKSLVDLSVGLDKRIIIEGVERLEIQGALLDLGCTYSQGFLHNKSLTYDKVCTLMESFDNVA